jgi:uncharacterized membrane protein YgaE (UPF0421/DUF939 family)
MQTDSTVSWHKNLNISEAIRAGLCMLPMLIAPVLGFSSIMVSLGQGGFFYSSLPVPAKTGQKMVMMFLLMGIGLGFYLIGGNVVFYFWLSILFTFMITYNIALLSSWNVLSMLAFSFISMYSSGLNSGSAEKTTENFLAFAFALLWAGLLTMFKFWKSSPTPPPQIVPVSRNLLTGFKLGFGTSLALLISNLLHFSKLGWAPSAVGNVIRFDEETSKKRAVARTIGTIGGAGISIAVLLIATGNITLIVGVSYVLAIVNGLLKNTKIGAMPLFYTATILLLYSSMDLSASTELAIQRIIYNLIGVVIALAVVLWSFPIVTKKIQSLNLDVKQESV